MNSKLIFFLVAFLCCHGVNAQKDIRESVRFVNPPVIDGQIDDWKTEWMMDMKSKFLYNLGNDNDNLYIRLKISDETAQQKICLFGLTVYLNPEGGKKGRLGLRYPLEKDREAMKKENPGAGAQSKTWNEMKKHLLRDAELLELIGLSKERILSSRVGLMNGIEVIMIVDSFGDLVYEAKIPFKAYRIDKSKVENLGVVIETGRLITKQSMSSAPATYYRGQRYSSPMSSQPYSEAMISTMVRLTFKLN